MESTRKRWATREGGPIRKARVNGEWPTTRQPAHNPSVLSVVGCGLWKNSVGKVSAENFALGSAISGCLEIGIHLPSFGDPKMDFFNTHSCYQQQSEPRCS